MRAGRRAEGSRGWARLREPDGEGRTGDATSCARCGVTLLELMVTLTLLAIIAGVVGLSMHRPERVRAADVRAAHIAAVRDSALRSGRAISVMLVDSGHAYAVTAFPDGRVLADPELRVDPLNGTVVDDSR